MSTSVFQVVNIVQTHNVRVARKKTGCIFENPCLHSAAVALSFHSLPRYLPSSPIHQRWYLWAFLSINTYNTKSRHKQSSQKRKHFYELHLMKKTFQILFFILTTILSLEEKNVVRSLFFRFTCPQNFLHPTNNNANIHFGIALHFSFNIVTTTNNKNVVLASR